MKTIWVMNAVSESCDHYDCCGSWDHEPSQDEINKVRAMLDAYEYNPVEDSHYDDDVERLVTVEGKKYVTFILDYSIKKITV